LTLAHAIAKALSGAEVLRQKATVPFTPNAEVALLIEQAKAIEHICAVARQHLKPAPSSDIAAAILAEMVPRFDDRMATAMRTPGQHMAEHGLREAVKAVRAKS
jgi:hypothetical protein